MSEADSLHSTTEHAEGPNPKHTNKLSRRMRPPDLEFVANMTQGEALCREKHGKSGTRRESRLGFGRFWRHRVVSETSSLKATRDTPESTLDDICETVGGPPYDLHLPGSHSDGHLVPSKEADTAPRPKTGIKSPTFTPPLGSPTMPINAKRRGSSAAATVWDPVPLFQAWPQAVRTATLPSCLQADSLLRLHNKREMLPAISHPDLGDEKDMFVAMAKKKHRRNSSSVKLDWTTKIYILVTSGYLLQYAGDGPHDCLPEKVVQLTKDSAAFASDVIPGKHWVLQVSSVFEDGAVVSQDTRSLLGKFGLREKEKRQASDILMIFESAADMDSWMTLLRKEIEVLGGKAPLSETGTPKRNGVVKLPGASPKQDDVPTLPEAQPMSPAGRPLVVKDPNFGQNKGNDTSKQDQVVTVSEASPRSPTNKTSVVTEPNAGQMSSVPEVRGWDAAITIESPELHLDGSLNELLPDKSFDDNSASNSFVSQDGRQLDGLRDSANRYSFMSSARTNINSDSSACNSPSRNSFGSGSSHPSDDATPMGDESDKCQLRPNGVEIENRRQSYRTTNMFFDPNITDPIHRQHSSLSVIQEPPNFSLPNRRRAASHTAVDLVHTAQNTTAGVAGRARRRPKRPPPPTLGYTRPLSVVADTPSPSGASPRIPMGMPPGFNASGNVCLESPDFFASWAAAEANGNKAEYDLSSRSSSRQSNMTSFRVATQTSPRKYASMNSLRPADRSVWDEPPQRDATPTPQHHDNTIPRSMPAMADNTPHQQQPQQFLPLSLAPRSRSPIQRAMAKAAHKRVSMYNLDSSRRSSVSAQSSSHRPTQSEGHNNDRPPSSTTLFRRSHSPQRSRGSMQFSIPEGDDGGQHKPRESASSLKARRSLPAIAASKQQQQSPVAGPPPLPPPNKALPPIPVGAAAGGGRKRRSGSVAPQPQQPRMRVVQSMASLPGGVPGGEF